MVVVAKIFNCNERTYREFYKDAVKRAFKMDGIDIDENDIRAEIVEIEGDTIHAQRNSDRHSRTISVYDGNELKYIIGVSNTGYDLDKIAEGTSRPGNNDYHSNTYICQGINRIFELYYTKKREYQNLKLFFYLLDVDTKPYPNNFSITIYYRMLYTLGFPILNIEHIRFSDFSEIGRNEREIGDFGYHSFNKFVNDLSRVSSRNTGNKPSYLKCIDYSYDIGDEGIEHEGEIDDREAHNIKYVYIFKALGAQGYDSFLKMRTLYTLARNENKRLEFLFLRERYHYRLGQGDERFTTDLSGPIRHLFEIIGIDIRSESRDEAIQDYHREEYQYQRAIEEDELRNQELFKNNMREKGVMLQCCLCGCEIESILEAAHLRGVAEIKDTPDEVINRIYEENDCLRDLIDESNPNANTPFYKKYLLANSGDNGVWLCRNHHRLLDSGFYKFNHENGNIETFYGDNEFFSRITLSDGLPEYLLTNSTKLFLRNHR